MNIETSQVKKIHITGIMESHKLDPITVILEDYEPGKGKIVVECYGQSWSAFWGAMSGDDIATFFCRCNEHYIAGKFSSISSTVDDYDGLQDKAKTEIIRMRRDLDLSRKEARELFDETTLLDESLKSNPFAQGIMRKIFGDEWWYSIPEKTNHHYEYLCRIIKAVQEALRALLPGLAQQIKQDNDENRDRVARAICVACDENPDHAGDCRGNEFRWQDYRVIAQAAIDAYEEF